MKKIPILLLAVLMLFAITACDNSTEAPETVNVPSWVEDGTYALMYAESEQTDKVGDLTIKNGDFSVTVGPITVNSSNITNITEQSDYVNAENQKEYKLAGTLSLTIPGQEPTSVPASFIFTRISDTELTLRANLGGSPMNFTCEMQ